MKIEITAVIPTLGDPSVYQTVSALNSGTIKPEKILVCIPNGYTHRLVHPFPSNVVIVSTEVMGQVAQRRRGFAAAETEFVLQLDDDISVAPDCLEKLAYTIEDLPRPSCAAARLIDPRRPNVAVYRRFRRSGYRLLYWLCNGKEGWKPSSVMKCGFNCPIPTNGTGSSPVRSEWLPGGIVLHRKQDLILSSFYPFRGKAYCEDLIHSQALTSAGVSLYLLPVAHAYYDYENTYDHRPIKFFTYLAHDVRARRYFVRMSHRSMARMYLYYFFISMNYWLVFLRHRFARALFNV